MAINPASGRCMRRFLAVSPQVSITRIREGGLEMAAYLNWLNGLPLVDKPVN